MRRKIIQVSVAAEPGSLFNNRAAIITSIIIPGLSSNNSHSPVRLGPVAGLAATAADSVVEASAVLADSDPTLTKLILKASFMALAAIRL